MGCSSRIENFRSFGKIPDFKILLFEQVMSKVFIPAQRFQQGLVRVCYQGLRLLWIGYCLQEIKFMARSDSFREPPRFSDHPLYVGDVKTALRFRNKSVNQPVLLDQSYLFSAFRSSSHF